jgi:uncharacterized protein
MDAGVGLAAGRPASPVITAIRRHPLAAYFLMAFAFTWIVAAPFVLSRSGIIAVTIPVTLVQIFGALAGPTLAALIVTAAIDGRTGIRQLLRRCVQWRAGIVWYVAVVLGPLLILTLAATAFLGSSFLSAFVRNLPQVLAAYIPALIIGLILGPLWEEPGWRGFALPRLQKGYGPVLGTAVLGVLWAAWHLPAFFGGWMGPLNVSSFAALIVSSIAFSWLMTWVYNNTAGSVLLMILLHSASNAAVSAGGRVLPADLPANIASIVYSGWIPAIGYTVAALLVLLLTRGGLSYRQDG